MVTRIFELSFLLEYGVGFLLHLRPTLGSDRYIDSFLDDGYNHIESSKKTGFLENEENWTRLTESLLDVSSRRLFTTPHYIFVNEGFFLSGFLDIFKRHMLSQYDRN